jgi:hypothetical protein
VPSGRLRKALLGLVLAAAALPAAAGAGADRFRLERPQARDLVAYRIVDTTVAAVPRRLSSWGGEYTTPSGATVRIEVSDAYAVDEAESQMWANFLDSLVHGPEIETVTAYFATFREVQAICGRIAAACYSTNSGRIVLPGEDVEDGPTVEALLAHEYGHHVAATRLNPPWRAVSHGTKRWASNLGVCPRSARGELAPGDDVSGYEINPGEIFAESYRVLNERRLGRTEAPWDVVSEAFYPDERSLALLEQDVLQPWTRNTIVSVRGRGTRIVRVATPLDGVFRATVTAPRGTTYRVSGPKTVCGRRVTSVRVTRVKGTGAFTLRISRP